MISIDTKKKELIGNFSREGHTFTQKPVDTLDHDFPSAGEGKLIPHGIYGLARNQGHMNLNTSHDTSEFCCDSIANGWKHYGCQHYPNACRLLLPCDGGGSNAANRHVFKEALQALAGLLGLEIRVAHYPPYCSNTTRLNIACFRTLRVPARVWCSIRSPLPNNSWGRLKPARV